MRRDRNWGTGNPRIHRGVVSRAAGVSALIARKAPFKHVCILSFDSSNRLAIQLGRCCSYRATLISYSWKRCFNPCRYFKKNRWFPYLMVLVALCSFDRTSITIETIHFVNFHYKLTTTFQNILKLIYSGVWDIHFVLPHKF